MTADLETRVEELQRERAVCPVCHHVYLFRNLGRPCHHCLIEAREEALREILELVRSPDGREVVHVSKSQVERIVGRVLE